MAEYIDRSDALDAANSFIHAESIRLALEQLPIADVEERKKGRWQWKSFEAFGQWFAVCSCCNFRAAGSWKYCPSCGARMVAE